MKTDDAGELVGSEVELRMVDGLPVVGRVESVDGGAFCMNDGQQYAVADVAGWTVIAGPSSG
jgi:hypothetical protein